MDDACSVNAGQVVGARGVECTPSDVPATYTGVASSGLRVRCGVGDGTL